MSTMARCRSFCVSGIFPGVSGSVSGVLKGFHGCYRHVSLTVSDVSGVFHGCSSECFRGVERGALEVFQLCFRDISDIVL